MRTIHAIKQFILDVDNFYLYYKQKKAVIVTENCVFLCVNTIHNPFVEWMLISTMHIRTI